MARVTVSPQAAEQQSGPERFEGAILGVFTLVAIAAVAFLLYSLERDAQDDPAMKAARGEVTVTSELSLLNADRFARAMKKVEDKSPKGSVVTYVRVEPARIDTEVRQPDNQRKILHVNPAFDVEKNDFGEGNDYGLAPGRVDAKAPARILAAASERYGFDRKDIDYMVWNAGSNSDDPADWVAFFKKGAPNNNVLAAADGSDVRRPGELSKKDKAEQRRREREQAARERENARRSRCLSAANTAQQVERCLK
jgi:hypothetical protein